MHLSLTTSLFHGELPCFPKTSISSFLPIQTPDVEIPAGEDLQPLKGLGIEEPEIRGFRGFRRRMTCI